MSTRPTVTIGIPAYNEGQTIGRLVRSLLKQDSSNFVLQSIVINSDGSSDDTVGACEDAGSDKVHVIVNRERRGKAVRQTELFRLNQSDIHVCFDADVMLAHRLVVSALVDGFQRNVGLVGGVVKAVTPETLLERTYVKEKEIWHDAVNAVHGGANIYNHEGRVSAVNRGGSRVDRNSARGYPERTIMSTCLSGRWDWNSGSRPELSCCIKPVQHSRTGANSGAGSSHLRVFRLHFLAPKFDMIQVARDSHGRNAHAATYLGFRFALAVRQNRRQLGGIRQKFRWVGHLAYHEATWPPSISSRNLVAET